MMDSLILDTFQPFALTKITTRRPKAPAQPKPANGNPPNRQTSANPVKVTQPAGHSQNGSLKAGRHANANDRADQ